MFRVASFLLQKRRYQSTVLEGGAPCSTCSPNTTWKPPTREGGDALLTVRGVKPTVETFGAVAYDGPFSQKTKSFQYYGMFF